MSHEKAVFWNECHLAQGLVRRLIRSYRRLPIKPFQSSLHALYARYQELYRQKRIIAEVDGIKYELDLDELIDRSIFFGGAFEPATASALKRLTQRGMTVLDIGANIGCHTCLLAQLAYPGTVIAFEPMPWPRKKLLKNIAMNGLRNVVVENFGLTDKDSGPATVHFRSSWQWSSRKARSGENPDSRRPAVLDFMTLDSYAARHDVKNIGLIKLDVDGYEMRVLRGATETLQTFRPILVVEFCHYSLDAVGDSLSDLIDLLSAMGYKIYREDTLLEFPAKAEILESIPADASINVVCSHEPILTSPRERAVLP